MINNNITIIGLGYTGLPLLIEFYKKKYNVSGFDKDFHKVQRLKAGIDLTNELRSNDLKKLKKINLVNNILHIRNALSDKRSVSCAASFFKKSELF